MKESIRRLSETQPKLVGANAMHEDTAPADDRTEVWTCGNRAERRKQAARNRQETRRKSKEQKQRQDREEHRAAMDERTRAAFAKLVSESSDFRAAIEGIGKAAEELAVALNSIIKGAIPDFETAYRSLPSDLGLLTEEERAKVKALMDILRDNPLNLSAAKADSSPAEAAKTGDGALGVDWAKDAMVGTGRSA